MNTQRHGLTGWTKCEDCPGCITDADIIDDAGSDVDYPDESGDQTEPDLEFENRLEEFFEESAKHMMDRIDKLIAEGRQFMRDQVLSVAGLQQVGWKEPSLNQSQNIIQENPTKVSWKQTIKNKRK